VAGARSDEYLVPRRELDEEKIGQRAGTPVSLIRKPIKEPPMQRVHADLTAATEEELRRRVADGNGAALAELQRRGGGSQ
jgi:hypothetical protein